MVDCKYRKQAGKAREILKKLENTEIISKIYYYLSHILKTVNMLNFELHDKKMRLNDLRLPKERLHRETELLEKTIREKEPLTFKNFSKTAPTFKMHYCVHSLSLNVFTHILEKNLKIF